MRELDEVRDRQPGIGRRVGGWAAAGGLVAVTVVVLTLAGAPAACAEEDCPSQEELTPPAGDYEGTLEVSIRSAGTVEGGELSIVTDVRPEGDPALRLTISDDAAPSYSGTAQVRVSGGIDGGFEDALVVGGSQGAAADLEVATTPDQRIGVSGTIPGGSTFSVTGIAPEGSATADATQEEGSLDLILVVDEADCEQLGGSIAPDSPSIVGAETAYRALGLETTFSGSWSVRYTDPDPPQAEIEQQTAAATANPLGWDPIIRLLEMTEELQLRGTPYHVCLSSIPSNEATRLTAEAFDVTVDYWSDRFGWDETDADGDGSHFRTPGSVGAMGAAMEAILHVYELADLQGAACDDERVQSLLGDIAGHLADNLPSWAPIPQRLAAAELVQLFGGEWSPETERFVTDLFEGAEAQGR